LLFRNQRGHDSGPLLDAGLDFNELETEIKKLGLPSVEIRASKVVKQNIASTQFSVVFEEQKHHRHLKDLMRWLRILRLIRI
jgi:pyridinium-3,5-bisthiocarboxylic acid mononucleotide nickel chelatase